MTSYCNRAVSGSEQIRRLKYGRDSNTKGRIAQVASMGVAV